MTQLAEIFKVNRQGFSLRRGAVFAVVLGLLIVVGVLPDDRRYFLTAIFGALIVAVSDPAGNTAPGGQDGGGGRGRCATDGAGVRHRRRPLGVGGAGRVRGHVAGRPGGDIRPAPVRRGVSAQRLVHHRPRPAHAPFLQPAGPVQVRPAAHRTVAAGAGLADRIGAWIAYTFIVWLVRGRAPQPQPVSEIPGDISPRPLTRPTLLFAVIRAAALAIAVAISFGLLLPRYWMPMATITAMKSSLQQSALIAGQPIAGRVVGAAVAALVLLAVDNRTALEVIVVVLVALAASVHGVTLRLVTAALGAAILIAADVPHPPNLADEGRRILFTFAGVGIAVIVMFLADQLQTHRRRTSTTRRCARPGRVSESGRMTDEHYQDLPPAKREAAHLPGGASQCAGRNGARGLLRASVGWPWDSLGTPIRLLIGLLVCGCHGVAGSGHGGARYPGLRAAEPLGWSLPPSTVVFASTTSLRNGPLRQPSPSSLTHTDAVFRGDRLLDGGFRGHTAKSECGRVVLIADAGRPGSPRRRTHQVLLGVQVGARSSDRERAMAPARPPTDGPARNSRGRLGLPIPPGWLEGSRRVEGRLRPRNRRVHISVPSPEGPAMIPAPSRDPGNGAVQASGR